MFLTSRSPRMAALLFAPLLSLSLHAEVFTPPASHRASFNFNYDWKVTKGDVPAAKDPAFDDSSWQAVSLPHTWVDNKFREWVSSKNYQKKENPYYGIGWYRKHFTPDAAWSGRKVFLEFQGIGRCAEFFVNGKSAGLHENGVAPCGIDISNLVKFGTDNVVAVKVDSNENYHTVQYNGANLPYGEPFNLNFGGLNRDVTLHISDKLYQTLPLYENLGTVGTYVFPSHIDTLKKSADLTIQTEVRNDWDTSKQAACEAVVVDRDGTVVANMSAPAQAIDAGKSLTFTLTGSLTNAHFWSPDFPYLYKVFTTLKVAGAPVDVCETPLGIRKITFSVQNGLKVNGHPLYLKGYAPRTAMEWPCVGTPVDWMNEYDFKLMKENHGNFLRPMHKAPRMVQVQAADKFGVVMVVPAANNEGDPKEPVRWQQMLDIMRDVTIYFRNNPSVFFYEACNQIISAEHMRDMVKLRMTWDPSGGRFSGTRTNDTERTAGIREYSSTMDGTGDNLYTPLWDAEYARGESPRRVWDESSPMLNPRWDGKNPDPTPAPGTVGDTTHKYLTGGYFYIASDYHQSLGLNTTAGDSIGNMLTTVKSANGYSKGYFRLQSSEDMVLQNLAKYYARYMRSPFVQAEDVSIRKGIMVGGAKIIWSDSVTDGRMYNMEMARVSGLLDGARLPKEAYFGLQVAQNTAPQVYVVGHWNYPAGTVKRVFVAANTEKVRLQVLDASGKLLKDYGEGITDFFPKECYRPDGDMVNYYVFAFDRVAWQPGIIRAIGYDKGKEVASHQKATAGPPAAVKLTPLTGPSNDFRADGSDIAMIDVEVVDAAGNRCPTYEDKIDFTCGGAEHGVFLGGYNSGIRYSTNLDHRTTGYSLNVECGSNRVFVRATRNPGAFTLNAAATAITSTGAKPLKPATVTLTSVPIEVANGLSTVWPRKYTVPLGQEPAPVLEKTPPPPPQPQPPPAPATTITALGYTGRNADKAQVVINANQGTVIYRDSPATFGPLPEYLRGADFVSPFLGDAGEGSSTDQYGFNVSRYSHIYQLIDAANDMPRHNDNDRYQWKKLPESVTINGRAMTLYKSRLMAPFENCYFATNLHGIKRFDKAGNMYLVFAAAMEKDLQGLAKSVTASKTAAGTTTSAINDGNPATRWDSGDSATFPQWIKLDLGKSCTPAGYRIDWLTQHNRKVQYLVELSDDDKDYQTSLDMRLNSAGNNDYRIPPLCANVGRYVKVTIFSAGGGSPAINEFVIHGVEGIVSKSAR